MAKTSQFYAKPPLYPSHSFGNTGTFNSRFLRNGSMTRAGYSPSNYTTTYSSSYITYPSHSSSRLTDSTRSTYNHRDPTPSSKYNDVRPPRSSSLRRYSSSTDLISGSPTRYTSTSSPRTSEYARRDSIGSKPPRQHPTLGSHSTTSYDSRTLGGNSSSGYGRSDDYESSTVELLSPTGRSVMDRRKDSPERDSVLTKKSQRLPSIEREMRSLSIEDDSSKGLTGLRNLGNTCFMNSILQCLANTRPLLEYCLRGDYKEDINKEISRMKGTLVTGYAKLMSSMWNGSDSVSPSSFKGEVERFAKRFAGYNQQDAQEFLIYLLEGLHEDLNRVKEKRKRHLDHSNEIETCSASEKARDSWKKYIECENSRIVDIFVGQLKSSLECLECGYTSNTFDPFLDLSLPIRKGRGLSDVSLLDCFELFTQTETLDTDERPTCARCKKRTRCTKKFSIQKFPKVLVIHLKRFSQDFSYRSKLSTDVKCPIRDLNLSSFSAENSAASLTYDLYAVCNHSGTPMYGHYTASAKHPYTAAWHLFNDARVSQISEGRVVTPEAYILFYALSERSSKI